MQATAASSAYLRGIVMDGLTHVSRKNLSRTTLRVHPLIFVLENKKGEMAGWEDGVIYLAL